MSTTTIDFDELFRLEYRPMVAFAHRKLGNWADAEEAVQVAFTVAWERRADYTPKKGSPAAWLTGVVKHRIQQIIDTRSRTIPVGGWEDEFGFEFEDRPAESNGLPCIADESTRNRVEAILNLLTDRERTAIELHALQGLTVIETAKRMGVTVKSAESAVINARKRIVNHRAQLDAVAVDPTLHQRRGVLSPEAEMVRSRADLLDRLTERQRQVLVLRYIKLMPCQTVARRLGISKETVRWTTALARRRLRAAAPELIPA